LNYRYGFELSAEGKVTEPERVSFPVAPGRVIDVSLTFPAGCSGLVGIRIFRGPLQLYPLTVGEWIVSDDATVHFPADFELDERPYALTLEGYNSDDTYTHTVSISVTLEAIVDPSQPVVDAIGIGLPAMVVALNEKATELTDVTVENMVVLGDKITSLLSELVQVEREANERLYHTLSIEELVEI
jgi:hypothetical protein